MPLSLPSRRALRLFWARHVCPTRLERDPAFRGVLADATQRGLDVAGFAGLAALVAFLGATLASSVAEGGSVVDAALDVVDLLTLKLRALAVAVAFLFLARLRPSVTLGRALLALYVLGVAYVFLADDLLYAGTLNLTAAWFGLLLLVTAGTVPFQPWQTALIGALLLGGLTAVVASLGGATTGWMLRFVYLVLATVIATAMTAAIYSGRFAQHRSARRLSRARQRLGERSRQLEAQRAALAQTVDDLQRMQTQLVQQEKMASLGQLTAGVAHELKNPLNFVNNFAQLTVELTDDLEAELRTDPARPVGEALDASAELLADLRTNAGKIREHGRRADGIIKSMLAHSRATPGPRRPARLNSLMQEYVGLAYHGMRAEHPGFNVTIETDLDPALGEVEMVPEEMGRVFLNLLDNAFAAVRLRAAIEADRAYQPLVRVVTRAQPGGGVRVDVTDNGPGMPEEVRARVFEPFFTTKPSGEGTGLGLSLSYDIVVHGHGGDLAATTHPGEGTTFTVTLPATFRPATPPPPMPARAEPA